MAASFISASSQRLTNSASPITVVPFTVGCWFQTDNTATQGVWSITDTGTSANYFYLRKIIGQLQLRCAAGAGAASVGVGTLVSNAWFFTLTRCISATNRRLSILNSDGSAAHGQETTSMTPTGIDTIAIGCLNINIPQDFLGGQVAEFWYTNTDIQADGIQTQDALLRQLAYGGPLSVPHIAKDIIEYRSFRKYQASDGDELSEVYSGSFGPQTWANVNGVTNSAHPSLPYWYVKPNQVQTELVI